jgi:hypothetical protein
VLLNAGKFRDGNSSEFLQLSQAGIIVVAQQLPTQVRSSGPLRKMLPRHVR